MKNLVFSSIFCVGISGYFPLSFSLSSYLAPALHGKILNSSRRNTNRSVLVSLALFSLSCLPAHARTYDLLLSTSSNHANSGLLSGKSVSGNIYVFSSPENGVTKVQFFLDNPNMTGKPYHTEYAAPYDFAGGSSTVANPFNTNTLATGSHTITAKIRLSDGTMKVVSSAFTIASNKTQTPPQTPAPLPPTPAATNTSTATPTPVSAIYVETNGNDANSGRSAASALRTLKGAVAIAQPGDTILVGPGTYKNSEAGGSVVDITKAGRADAWITIRSREKHKAILSSNGWNVVLFGGGAAYWNIEDFEAVGNAKQITLDYALSQKDIANPLTNGDGISADGRGSSQKPHHITVRNNIVHDVSGCGICTMQADYFTIEGNTVYDTSHYTRYATSGISLYQMWNTDSNTGYKNIIRNNFVYRNQTYVPWAATGKVSDGNGIIIDDFRHTQNNSTGTPYLGRTLVINNISALNGGSGMHAYSSDKVDFVNNIAYHNSESPDLDYEEIFAAEASDVRMINNIIVPRSDGSVTSAPSSGSTNVLFDYNIFFSKPLVGFPLKNNKQIDPLYSVDEANPLLSMFRPASQFTNWIDAGLDLGDVRLGGVYPPDFDGGVRPKGLTPDIGPFEK